MEDDKNKVPETISGAEAENLLARERVLARGINPDTGLPIGLKAVSKPPKKNCKKCYGRGYIGLIDGDVNKPYPCMCTIEIVPDIPEPPKEKITIPILDKMESPKEDSTQTNTDIK